MQEEECRKLRYKTSLSTCLEIEDIHWPKREKKKKAPVHWIGK
jgi:hypothetical protein